MVGSAILAVLVLGVTKLMMWGTKAFSQTTWKINAQQEMRIFLRKLKEDLSKATYPSVISFEGVRFVAVKSGGLTDNPGASECIQYRGNGTAFNPGDKFMGISRMTFLSDDMSASSLETHGIKKAMPKFKDAEYDDYKISYASDNKEKVLLQFIISSPDSTDVGDADDKGTAQLCRVLLDGRKKGNFWGLRYQRSEVVKYQASAGSISGSLTNFVANRIVVDDVVRVDITHELLPNDPPIGDYDSSKHLYQYLQPLQSGSSQIKKVDTPADLAKKANVDMRRCSLLTIMFMLRQSYKKTADGFELVEPGLSITEPLEVKTSVHVLDQLTY